MKTFPSITKLESVLALLLFSLFTTIGRAAPGDLDPSFNGTGTLRCGYDSSDSNATAIAQQSDGKLIVVGTSFNGFHQFAVARYNIDGSLDLSFGIKGRTFIDYGSAFATAVALQTDGKIVVSGWANGNYGGSVAVARLNSDGSLDSSFGNGGKVSSAIGTVAGSSLRAVAIQSTGKIVVAGAYSTSYYDYISGFILVRYTADGVLDSTFGNAGVTISTFNGSGAVANAIAIQSDDSILAAGSTEDSSGKWAFTVARYSPDGVLDPTFGQGGEVRTTLGASSDGATAIAIQSSLLPNGTKIVVAGNSQVGSYYVFGLVRYNLDGTLDPTFDGDGMLTTRFTSTSSDAANAIQISYKDGEADRICAGGYSSNSSSSAFFAVARYLTNGALDTSFNGTGKVTSAVGPSSSNAAAMVGQSGKLVLAGSTTAAAGNSEFALARYNQEGSLDLSFDGDGIRVDDFGEGHVASATGAAIQLDGKILVTGVLNIGILSGGLGAFGLTRFNPDGSPDSSFGVGGKVLTPLKTNYQLGHDPLGIQLDGKIVVAGPLSNGTFLDDFELVRYNTDGSLDTTFNSTGKVTTSLGGDDIPTALAIQTDGKIVVSGKTRPSGGHYQFALVRYNATGSLDTSFNTTGIAKPSFGTNLDEYANGVVLQPDGRTVVAGAAGNNFAVVRYNADGSLDPSFNSNGKVRTSIGSSSIGNAVAIQGGKILVVGYSSNGTNKSFALARYNTDGSLDSSFNNTGIVTTSLGAEDDAANAVAIQLDGKILVAGSSGAAGSNEKFALLRYNPDGSLDNTFGNAGVVLISLETGYDSVNALALDALGRIVVAGFGNAIVGVARVLGDPFVKITSIVQRASDGHIILDGLALPNVSVSLQQAVTLDNNSFSFLSPVVPNASGNWEVDLGLASGPRFYELTSGLTSEAHRARRQGNSSLVFSFDRR